MYIFHIMRVGASLSQRQDRRGPAAVFLPFFLLGLCFFSCDRGPTELPVIPPPTNPLRREILGYGVVSAAYTHVVSEPGAGGLSKGYLRRGALVGVLERQALSNETWVLVDGAYQGWLPEGVIQIYDNEARARTAVESMNR